MEKRKEYKKSKRKVVLSVLALLICVAMLLGTTLAWFTDSVTSGRNRIVAGELDIEAYHTNREVTEEQIDINTTLFTDVELWEPGAVDYENIKVKNVGTVAAKVKLQLLDAAKNKMKEGDYDLTQIIQVGVKEGGFTAPITRESIISDPDVTFTPFAVFEKSFELLASADKTYGVALYWKPTEFDNNWNANNGKETSDGKPLWIEFGLNVLATQYTYEEDSFDEKYDKDATYPYLAPVVDDVAVEEIEQTGQAVEITSEAGTSIIPAAENNVQIVASTKVDEPSTEKNNYEMQAEGNLVRCFSTTASSAESVTYDISYIYQEGTDAYNVSEFKGVVTNILSISTGLKNVRITHSHGGTSTEMTKTDNPDLGQDGYFYYNATDGMLKIWSKKYSEFKIQYDTEYAAAVDGQGFMTLKKALAAAADGNTVTLLKDVAEESIVINKSITLRGDGKKLTASGDAIIVAANDVTLNKLSAASANGIALVVNKDATGTVVTRGSYQSGTTAVGKQGEGAIRFMGGNGNISVTKASLLGGIHVLNYVSGTPTISDNTFAVDASLAERKDIVCGILIYGSGAKTPAGTGDAYLNDNTFSDSKANYKVLIQGADWKTYYSDKAVAKVGDYCYETLADAITAVADDGKIEMLKDVTLTEEITVNKSLTINLNGKTITGEETYLKADTGVTKTVNETSIVFVAPALVHNNTELNSALSAKKAKIIIAENFTTSGWNVFKADTEIDLNGKTLTIGGSNGFASGVSTAINVTLKNGSVDVIGHLWYAQPEETTYLKFDNVTVTSQENGTMPLINFNKNYNAKLCDLTVDGLNYNGTRKVVQMYCQASGESQPGNLTFKNCNITSTQTIINRVSGSGADCNITVADSTLKCTATGNSDFVMHLVSKANVTLTNSTLTGSASTGTTGALVHYDKTARQNVAIMIRASKTVVNGTSSSVSNYCSTTSDITYNVN